MKPVCEMSQKSVDDFVEKASENLCERWKDLKNQKQSKIDVPLFNAMYLNGKKK